MIKYVVYFLAREADGSSVDVDTVPGLEWTIDSDGMLSLSILNDNGKTVRGIVYPSGAWRTFIWEELKEEPGA